MSDVEEVIQTVESMTRSFHEGDLEKVMDHYEQPSTIVFEPGVGVSDPELQRQGFRNFFALSPRFTYGGHEVFVAGNYALHIAPWTMRGTGPGGAAVNQSGLSVAVLVRQNDGTWLLVLDDPFGAQLLQRS